MSDSETIDDNDPFPHLVEIEITDTIDLHSFRPDEVSLVVEAYLQEAKKKNLKVVKIIHGKGIGVQREIVRSVLKRSGLVKGFKNGAEFSGNWGATIAELK